MLMKYQLPLCSLLEVDFNAVIVVLGHFEEVLDTLEPDYIIFHVVMLYTFIT